MAGMHHQFGGARLEVVEEGQQARQEARAALE